MPGDTGSQGNHTRAGIEEGQVLEITLRGANVQAVPVEDLIIIRAEGKGTVINLALDQENAAVLVDDILALKVRV